MAAWSEFDKAKTALRAAKTSVDTSTIDMEKGQKELAELQKNRRDRIIAAINEFN